MEKTSIKTRGSSLTAKEVNVETFNAIRREISCNANQPVPQPIIVVGEMGSGKTTLLRRLYEESGNNGLRGAWIDGRSVFDSNAIISVVVSSEASMLFVDDMDYFFTRCSYEEQFRLRHYLYNEGAPMLIASVNRVLPSLAEYKAPFFEGVKNLYIEPISMDDIRSAFAEKDQERVMSVLKLLPPTIKSLKTAEHIMRFNNMPERDADFLLSMFDEKYSNIYQSLPTNAQHILNVLGSGDGDGITIPQIRHETALPTGAITPYLKTLRTRGFVGVDKSVKRATRYVLTDPLFRLWLASLSKP